MDGTRILGLAGLLCLTGCWQGPHQAGPPRPAVVTVEPATAALTKAQAFAARVDGEPAAGRPGACWRRAAAA